MSIVLTSNFDEQAPLPLDKRTVVVDNIARDAIPSGVRYEGLMVYNIATKVTYQLQGGITNSDWMATGAGGADLVSTTLATTSGAVALTTVNSLGVTFAIPIAGTDALTHVFSWGAWDPDYSPFLTINIIGAGGSGATSPLSSVNFGRRTRWIAPISGNAVDLSLEDLALSIPFTSLLEATQYGFWSEANGGTGGSFIGGFTSDDSVALQFIGGVGSISPTQGAIEFIGAKSNGGTSIAPIGDNELFASFVNSFGGATIFSMFGDGSIQNASRIAIGSDSTLGLSGSFDKLFDFSGTITDFSTSLDWQGMKSVLTLSPTVNIATTSIYGHLLLTQIPNTNTHNIGHIEGITGYVENSGSGNVINGFAGLTGIAQWSGSGTVDDISGSGGQTVITAGTVTVAEGTFSLIEATGGTTTTAISNHILSPISGGTITNYWGLKIDDQVFTGATVYAIQTGLGLISFGDDVQMGTRIAAGSGATFSANHNFSFSESRTAFPAANYTSLISVFTLNPSANTTNEIWAEASSAIIPSGSTHTILNVVGKGGYLLNSGSGTLTAGAGMDAEAINQGTGPVGSMYGITASGLNLGSGTITNNGAGYFQSGASSGTNSLDRTIFIDAPLTGGTLTTHIGLDIANQNVGTTSFAIRTGLGKIKFGDDVSIGAGLSGTVAALELVSTTKGFLSTRMTTTQRNAITPVEGLSVYDLTLHKNAQYNGTTWILQNDPILSGTSTLASGTATITAPITASSRIIVTVKDANPGAGGLTVGLEAPSASRSVGTSFVVRANVAAGTINILDTSTFDWVVVG